MPILATAMSQAYAAMGEKDLALKLAEYALMLDPAVKNTLRIRNDTRASGNDSGDGRRE